MMGAVTLCDIAGSLESNVDASVGSASVASVSIDSRKITADSLFVALSGENVDGHDYIESARASGAAAALVERLQASELPQILVNNTQAALGVVGQLNREAFTGSVVALTGSAGKTSCKNMLASILSQRFSVCSTEGNLNNELGVPLTLSRIGDDHDVAVVEMGAAQQGDIDYLVRLATPNIAILTNVAEAHIGRFGDIETTARTKGEIFSRLRSGDLAVINADDAFASDWRRSIEQRNTSIRISDFSVVNPSARAYATNIVSHDSGLHFTLNYRETDGIKSIPVKLSLLGRHNVANALAAAIAALDLGCSLKDVARGLAAVQAAKGRLQLRRGRNELLLIDDSYNANPQAMQAAVDVSEALAVDRPRVVVLGDMAELGEHAAEKHKAVGSYVAQSQQNNASLTGFFAWGEYAGAYERGYQSRLGNSASSVFGHLSSKQEIVTALLSENCRGAVVLVKGSRSAAMEEIVDELCRIDEVDEKDEQLIEESNKLC